MFTGLPINDILVWAFAFAAPAIVLGMYQKATFFRRTTPARKVSELATLIFGMVSSVLFSLALVEVYFGTWGVSEIFSDALSFLPGGTFFAGLATSLAAAIFATVLLIAAMISFDRIGEHLAVGVALPLWAPAWEGTIKEKTVRGFFQLVLLWFMAGAFVHILNITLGNALLGSNWMESFAWLVGLPALMLWWYGGIFRPGRSALQQ